jgi:hypothetical protein
MPRVRTAISFDAVDFRHDVLPADLRECLPPDDKYHPQRRTWDPVFAVSAWRR